MAGEYQAYPEYKDSGVKWLGKIPKHWEWLRLKYTVTLGTNKVFTNPDHRYIGMENVASWSGTYIPKDVSPSDGLSTTFSKGDVLFGKLRPYLAKSWLAEFSGCCSPEFLVLKKPITGGPYFHHYTLTKEFINHVDSATYGAKMPRASWDFIGLMEVPIPANDESKQIANFLDHETAKIDNLIEKQQELITLLKEKRQAVISHAVTKGLNPNAPMKPSGVEWLGDVPAHWCVLRLKNVSTIVDCNHNTPEYIDNGDFLVVRTTNVKNQKLILDGARYTDKVNFDIWTKRLIPPPGSILFTREAPTGEVCLVPPNLKLCMGQRMMNFICHNPIHNTFLFDYLISDCLERYINSVSYGSTVSHLRNEQVQNIPVLIPPENEIKEIHLKLTTIKLKYAHLTQEAEKAIALMQERRTALISAAVTGKIDVRNWQAPQSPSEDTP